MIISQIDCGICPFGLLVLDSPLHDRLLLQEACPAGLREELGEVGKRAFPGPEKHRQEVAIAGSMRG
ncbi:MAG: hypothetical protein ACK4SF_00320 [Algoriphagus aquaeductus]|uniref:hypothetical protein n=1 Tax=Algoriphagus aquaeductus TaxID=475299 RepID=UPI00391D07CD